MLLEVHPWNLALSLGFSLPAVLGCLVACSSRVNGWTINLSRRHHCMVLKHWAVNTQWCYWHLKVKVPHSLEVVGNRHPVTVYNILEEQSRYVFSWFHDNIMCILQLILTNFMSTVSVWLTLSHLSPVLGGKFLCKHLKIMCVAYCWVGMYSLSSCMACILTAATLSSWNSLPSVLLNAFHCSTEGVNLLQFSADMLWWSLFDHHTIYLMNVCHW